jgi:hypothetical protein
MKEPWTDALSRRDLLCRGITGLVLLPSVINGSDFSCQSAWAFAQDQEAPAGSKNASQSASNSKGVGYFAPR